MAITDASRALEPAAAQPIGWSGKTLRQMIDKQERLFAETGHYWGLETLDLQPGDPIRYEKIFSRLRGGLVSARETAMNISASPIVKEIGELSFMLYTPEGDSIALSRGIIVHVHTASDAIKYMIRAGYDKSFDTLGEAPPAGVSALLLGCTDIEITDAGVRLPAGTRRGTRVYGYAGMRALLTPGRSSPP